MFSPPPVLVDCDGSKRQVFAGGQTGFRFEGFKGRIRQTVFVVFAVGYGA